MIYLQQNITTLSSFHSITIEGNCGNQAFPEMPGVSSTTQAFAKMPTTKISYNRPSLNTKAKNSAGLLVEIKINVTKFHTWKNAIDLLNGSKSTKLNRITPKLFILESFLIIPYNFWCEEFLLPRCIAHSKQSFLQYYILK